MNLKALGALLRLPHLQAQADLTRASQSFFRLNFLYTASDSGLLDALKTPATKTALIGRLNVQRPDLVEVLLELLRSTAGCAPLPQVDELVAQLTASGFSRVKKIALTPVEPFYGIVAQI